MENSTAVVERIQHILRESSIDGWLFFDFRGSDPIGYQVLGLDAESHTTRRWFYLIPAEGTPVKIVHRIERGKLDSLPGERKVYLGWPSLQDHLGGALAGLKTLAMQYSPEGAIPYVSKVDAGTLELVRRWVPEIKTSANLIQYFECVWSDAQLAGHRESARIVTQLMHEAFERAQQLIHERGATDEMEIQDFLMRRLNDESMETDFPPIVAANGHAGDPHYAPEPGTASAIRRGDLLLIDLWAKKKEAGAVYADITWTGFLGSSAPSHIQEVFDIVRRARDAGVDFLGRQLGAGKTVQGWQVDDAVRQVIRDAGYGDFFLHRTGHNVGMEVHGNGVNFDNLETHDTREVVTGIGCTIEPGIYLEDFGIRSELNVYITASGPEVTTPPQGELLLLEA